MSIQETINQHLTSLPENLQAEILDFVMFLKYKQHKSFYNSDTGYISSILLMIEITPQATPSTSQTNSPSLTARSLPVILPLLEERIEK